MINTADTTQVEMFENKEVMQHNAITSGRYDFTACQLDIMFMLLGFLEKGKGTYRIYAKDIEQITGRRWEYGQLREATENMGSRMFEIETAKSYKQIWLFSQVEYLHGTGSFEVTINEKVMPYFFDLKNNFTLFKLKAVLSCSSKYAKRIYAYACQWRKAGYRKTTIVEFKKMLGLIDNRGLEQYKQIGQFREKVLDIAKRQINESTDIEFDYRLIKRGRSFQEIEIFVNRSQVKQQLQIDFQKDIEVQKFYAYLVKIGFSEKYAGLLSVRITYDIFKNDLNQAIKSTKNKGELLSNSVAYMTKIYQNKGII